MDHQLRRTALAGRLPELAVDAFLITGLTNVRYLTGFTGSSGQALVAGTGSIFFTDGRYTEQSRHEVADMDRVTAPGSLAQSVAEQTDRLGISTLGFEANQVTVRTLERLASAMPDITLVPLDDEVEQLRWVKDDEELGYLRAAQEATDQAFEDILESLAVGQTELAVARELERLLRRDGADGLSFDSIVAFGENAAEPHHEPNRRVLEEGDVIKVDFGALCAGYHADMTRTVAFGEPASELKKVHDVVKQSQHAGIDAVRAGASGGDIDDAARSVIEDAGYGSYFTHGLGHGVGLDIHEGPRLGKQHGDQILPAGAVVTVEPGIYIPGLGGVRIEDMVEVTDDGCRVLGTSSRDLIEL